MTQSLAGGREFQVHGAVRVRCLARTCCVFSLLKESDIEMEKVCCLVILLPPPPLPLGNCTLLHGLSLVPF